MAKLRREPSPEERLVNIIMITLIAFLVVAALLITGLLGIHLPDWAIGTLFVACLTIGAVFILGLIIGDPH